MWNPRALVLLLPVLLLTACKSAVDTGPAHELAQQCVTVKNFAAAEYLVSADAHANISANDSAWQFSRNAADAEAFFLKPAALDSFLLYDRAGRFLSTSLIKVTRDAVASKRAEWRIHKLALYVGHKQVDEKYTLVSIPNNLRLLRGQTGPVIKGTGDRVQTDYALDLVPQPADACREFPEAALDAQVAEDFYSHDNSHDTPHDNPSDSTSGGTSDDTPVDSTADSSTPVAGFADLHTHLGFPQSMAGLAMSGDLFHRYGIEHALHDCKKLHGENGALDLLEGQRASGGAGGHATAGYPDFPYWPRRETSTHVQAYYRWIQRAHLGGLRLLVTHVTGNPTLCQLLSLMKAGRAEGDCSSASEIANQTLYLYEMQDYIDAQEGGPGKGWFRIATSAAQARQIISQNKLAVVLGSEYGTLFDCNESSTVCTPDYIDRELEKLHALGIRVVFPIHRFDNAFGGTRPDGGVAGAWMHISGMLNTSKAPRVTQMLDPFGYLFKPIGGHFWELETCPDGIEGVGNIMSMNQFINEDFRILTNGIENVPTLGPVLGKLLDYGFYNKLGPLPEYTEFQDEHAHACNTMPLHPAGAYLVNRLIDKGMLLDIDHMGHTTQMETLDILEQRQYAGVVSSHSWTEDNPDIRARIFRLGGQISPFNHRPTDNAEKMTTFRDEMTAFEFPVGIGMGSDIQGVTAQTDGDPGITISYPFTSIDGKVIFTQPQTGNRVFDYHTEGVAHYGMLAEWVENLRQIDEDDPADLMGMFMNSAETFLQMWERAERSAAN